MEIPLPGTEYRALVVGKSYKTYVADREANEKYIAYQERYRDEPRGSDVRLSELVAALAPLLVLDVGCSTGNLVRLLRRRLPLATVWGCDLMAEALPDDTTGFFVADALNLPDDIGRFDAVILNAVLYQLTDAEVECAFRSARGVLNDGSHLVVFDLFHEWDQTLRIVEESEYHRDGLPLTVRSYDAVVEMAEAAGFEGAEFFPFHVRKNLPRPADRSDLTTHTPVPGYSFRGSLYQPWCHAVFRAA